MPATEALLKAKCRSTNLFIDDLLVDGWVREDNVHLNSANWDVLREMRIAYGDCWIGQINLYGEDRKIEAPRIIWNLDNWESGDRDAQPSFCVPHYSQELYDLILKRDRTSYDSTKHDQVLVEEIHQLIYKLEGFVFVWS